MKFKFQPITDPHEQETKELTPDYADILKERIADFEATLAHGLDSFETLDLSQAAKDFRKLATDLKLTELLITKRGKLNPKNVLNDLTGKEWLQHTKSWVIVDGKSKDITAEIKDHPASFPPELAEYFISFFTQKNGWVLDPFMGIGSTAQACFNVKRNCIGIELNPKYIEYARKRVSNSIYDSENATPEGIIHDNSSDLYWYLFQADARKALELWKDHNLSPVDFVITSPPYWNMLKKSRGGVKSSQKQRIEDGLDEYYSDDAADLGNIEDFSAYMNDLVRIFGDLQPMLKSGAYLMVILQNCRTSEGDMLPIAWKFAEAMQAHYSLKQEFVWLQDQKFLGIWGWPTTYVSNVHHHYCLVFQN